MEACIEAGRQAINPASSSAALSTLHDRCYGELSKNYKKYAAMIDKFLAETGTAQQNPIAATFLLYAKISSSIDTHALPLSPSNSRTAQPLPYSHELIQALYYVALGLDPNWLQLVAKELIYIVRHISRHLIATEKYIKGLLPIKILVHKLTDLVLLTLKSHSYDLLLSPLLLDFSTSSTNPPIISQSYLTSITTFTHNVEEKWTLDVLDYLTYWYYLGMVWCALKKWELAQEALLMTLVIPTSQVSAVQVAAYKKYILVSLLYQGELPTINPRLISPSVQRVLDTLCSSYLDIAKCMKSRSSIELVHLFQMHVDDYRKDINMGLIQQIVGRHSQQQIMKLTQTYLTLNLKDIAVRAKIDSETLAEKNIFQLICNSEIVGSIDERAQMVAFSESEENYNSAECASKLDAKIQQVIELGAKLQSLDQSFGLNPHYLSKSMPQLQSSNFPGSSSMQHALFASMFTNERRGGPGREDSMDYDDDEQMNLALAQSMEHR